MNNNLSSSPDSNDITLIILAAGQGTRMKSKNHHKVCHDLNGKPVIGHMIEIFAECGITKNVLVVGQLAEQVMQETSRFDDTALFCFQAEQHGTGHAAKQAARVLKKLNYQGLILVTAGDKVYDLNFLKAFIAFYQANPCDLLFVTGPFNKFPTSGKVIFSDQNIPVGIIEVFDIAKFKTLNKLSTRLQKGPLSLIECENIILEYLDGKKAEKAFGTFLNNLKTEKNITYEMFNKYFTPDMYELTLGETAIQESSLDKSTSANLSVYLFKAASLYYAVEHLDSKNAQKEEYLTDAVEILAQNNAKIKTYPVKDITNVMAFNTPEELDKIRKTMVK